MLFENASVHHHFEAGTRAALPQAASVVDYTFLHPDALRSNANRRIDEISGTHSGFTKDVDDVDMFANLFQ